MNGDKTARAGLFISVLDAIGIAVLAARKVAAAAPGAVVQLSKEVMELLISMAEGVGAILSKMDEVIDAIKAIPSGGGGGGGGGYPPNADSIASQYVNCPQVLPNASQLPDIPIPTGMQITLLARNGAGAALNAGIIWVSNSQASAGQPFQSYPLTPGATISYAVKNAKSIWIGATIANEGVFITVEVMGG